MAKLKDTNIDGKITFKNQMENGSLEQKKKENALINCESLYNVTGNSQLLTAHNNTIYVGNPHTPLKIESSTDPILVKGKPLPEESYDVYKFYHEGYKPRPEDINCIRDYYFPSGTEYESEYKYIRVCDLTSNPGTGCAGISAILSGCTDYGGRPIPLYYFSFSTRSDTPLSEEVNFYDDTIKAYQLGKGYLHEKIKFIAYINPENNRIELWLKLPRYYYGTKLLVLTSNKATIFLDKISTELPDGVYREYNTEYIYSTDNKQTEIISNIYSTHLNGFKDSAIINSTAFPGNNVAIAKTNAFNGYFTIGSYENDFSVLYADKETVDGNNNRYDKRIILLNEKGNTILGNILYSKNIYPQLNDTYIIGNADEKYSTIYVNQVTGDDFEITRDGKLFCSGINADNMDLVEEIRKLKEEIALLKSNKN